MEASRSLHGAFAAEQMRVPRITPAIDCQRVKISGVRIRPRKATLDQLPKFEQDLPNLSLDA
jgi:hypothetical protein